MVAIVIAIVPALHGGVEHNRHMLILTVMRIDFQFLHTSPRAFPCTDDEERAVSMALDQSRVGQRVRRRTVDEDEVIVRALLSQQLGQTLSSEQFRRVGRNGAHRRMSSVG